MRSFIRYFYTSVGTSNRLDPINHPHPPKPANLSAHPLGNNSTFTQWPQSPLVHDSFYSFLCETSAFPPFVRVPRPNQNFSIFKTSMDTFRPSKFTAGRKKEAKKARGKGKNLGGGEKLRVKGKKTRRGKIGGEGKKFKTKKSCGQYVREFVFRTYCWIGGRNHPTLPGRRLHHWNNSPEKIITSSSIYNNSSSIFLLIIHETISTYWGKIVRYCQTKRYDFNLVDIICHNPNIPIYLQWYLNVIRVIILIKFIICSDG